MARNALPQLCLPSRSIRHPIDCLAAASLRAENPPYNSCRTLFGGVSILSVLAPSLPCPPHAAPRASPRWAAETAAAPGFEGHKSGLNKAYTQAVKQKQTSIHMDRSTDRFVLIETRRPSVRVVVGTHKTQAPIKPRPRHQTVGGWIKWSASPSGVIHQRAKQIRRPRRWRWQRDKHKAALGRATTSQFDKAPISIAPKAREDEP